MTWEWVKGLLDVRKLPWWLLVATAITSGAALMAGGRLAGGLGLSAATAEHRLGLGLAFIFSTVATALRVLGLCWAWIVGWVRARRDLGKLRVGLMKLSGPEKEMLRRYITSGTKTQNLSYTNGVARGLEASGVIYRASSVSIGGQPGMLFPFNLQPWAWEYLALHPEVLADERAESNRPGNRVLTHHRRRCVDSRSRDGSLLVWAAGCKSRAAPRMRHGRADWGVRWGPRCRRGGREPNRRARLRRRHVVPG